jgi:hypothetical protein
MVGGQLRTTAFGTTSEHLAEAFLSAFAFTTRVRREEDLGHDFHCVLHEHGGDTPAPDRGEDSDAPAPSSSGVLSAGPPFNVQVKSDRKPISYEKPHARKWIGTQQSPFFVIVVSRRGLTFDVHSAWNLQNAIQNYGYGSDTDNIVKIEFTFPQRNQKWSGFSQNPIRDPLANNRVLSIPLGPPIVTTTMKEVMEPEKAKNVAAVLRDWIEFDRANIFRQATRMHWVYGPDIWESGVRLDARARVVLRFFVNPNNLDPDPKDPHRPTIGENLVWSAWAMKQTIEQHLVQRPGEPIKGVNLELMSAISSVLSNGSGLVRYGRDLVEFHEFTSLLLPNQPINDTA